MSSLLEELKKDFGFSNKQESSTLEINGYSWDVERIPFFLLPNYEYLVNKYSEVYALVALSITKINHAKITTVFNVDLPSPEESRRVAGFMLAEFLFTKIDFSLVKKLADHIKELFFKESISTEEPSEIFEQFITDPKMSMMLYLMDRYHWHFNEIQKYSTLQLNLIYRHAQKKETEDKQYASELLGKHLGTTWDAEDFFSKEKHKGSQDKAFIPLSLVIENKLPEYLKKILRSSKTGTALHTGISPADLGKPSQIVDMSEFTPDEFMNMITNHKIPEKHK